MNRAVIAVALAVTRGRARVNVKTPRLACVTQHLTDARRKLARDREHPGIH